MYRNSARATALRNRNLRTATDLVHSGPLVPKVCPADSNGIRDQFSGIGGYISAVGTLEVTFLKLK